MACISVIMYFHKINSVITKVSNTYMIKVQMPNQYVAAVITKHLRSYCMSHNTTHLAIPL